MEISHGGSYGRYCTKATLLMDEIKQGKSFPVRETMNGQAFIEVKPTSNPQGKVKISGSMLGMNNDFDGGVIDMSQGRHSIPHWIAGVDRILVTEDSPLSGIDSITIIVERW